MAGLTARDKWTWAIALGAGISSTSLRFLGQYYPTQQAMVRAYPYRIDGNYDVEWLNALGMLIAVAGAFAISFTARRLPAIWAMGLPLAAMAATSIAYILDKAPADYSLLLGAAIVGLGVSLPAVLVRFIQRRRSRKNLALAAASMQTPEAWPPAPAPTIPDTESTRN